MTDPTWFHLWWIVPWALLIIWLGSPRFLGTQAKNRLQKLLRPGLNSRRFTQFKDLRLSAGSGVLELDCLVVSPYGIFVIDALYLPGVVSGKKVQATWRRKRLGRQFKLDNPVHQNYLKVQALQQALGLPLDCFHPVVALSGQSRIETDALNTVMDVASVSRFINGQARQLLSAEQISQILLRIQNLRLNEKLLGQVNRWRWLRLVLLIGLLVLSWRVYHNHLKSSYVWVVKQVEQARAPENFNTDGTEKSALEKWEDQLICSYSVDTGRCSCYEPGGEKAELTSGRCRELAERGSILKQ